MFSLFKRKNNDIESLYQVILDQSLNPDLYTQYDVPDTPQGRFQMIALHSAPIFISLAAQKQIKKSQALFDYIFQDIEYSFREIGVGDLSVPKKMKRYMQDFNGILQAHSAANADHSAITSRNLYGEDNQLTPAFKKYINELF